MKELRVTIKRATLEEIAHLLDDGDSPAAREVVREALDDFRQAELQRCKDEAYRRFRKGKISYEGYRELWEYADSFMR